MDQPWETFNHAWQYLYPGDTLILLDGVYNQSINPNVRDGSPGYPITVKALHDGKAIIDGQNARVTVSFGYEPNGWWAGSYFVIEGVVARNSSESVYEIDANHVTLRRVSGYNANKNDNVHVYVIQGNYNLIEDCVAAGIGRKMIVVYASQDIYGQHNTIRRCFTSYRNWDGRNFTDEWPWNENYEAYSADYTTFENDIAYGYFANAGFSLLAQGGGDNNTGNKILGSIAIMGGLDFEDNPIHWGDIRPQPSVESNIKNVYEPCHRTGIFMGHGSTSIIQNNLIQDVFSWGNASLGLCVAEDPQMINNVVNRVTIYHNGLDLPVYNNSIDMRAEDLSGLSITNSRIDVIKSSGQSFTGEGARLQNRYINGVLKDGSDGTPAQPLWPWPMEQRIRDEMGISVTNLIAGIIPSQVSPIQDDNRPFLAVSPAMEPFGQVQVGQSSSRFITLKNLGTGSLSVDQYQITGGPYSVTSGGTCPNLPFTLTPSQSCTVRITFQPQNTQTQTEYIYFNSNDLAPYPASPNVYLSGIGR